LYVHSQPTFRFVSQPSKTKLRFPPSSRGILRFGSQRRVMGRSWTMLDTRVVTLTYKLKERIKSFISSTKYWSPQSRGPRHPNPVISSTRMLGNIWTMPLSTQFRRISWQRK
jgi:hypothetical protein